MGYPNALWATDLAVLCLIHMADNPILCASLCDMAVSMVGVLDCRREEARQKMVALHKLCAQNPEEDPMIAAAEWVGWLLTLERTVWN